VPEPAADARRIRVLVVDDSAVARKLLSTLLSRDPGIEVVGTAADGSVALDKARRLRPDVMTLDLEMPRVDGLDVLRGLDGVWDGPVLVVSAHTPRDAQLTAAALAMGAVDVVAKPASLIEGGTEALARALIERVRAVGGRRWRRTKPSVAVAARRPVARAQARCVVALGASTGGPAALAYLLPQLPADLPAAVLIVQHMPEGFTGMLAQRLDESCALRVREARDGELLREGEVLVAPAGRQLRVRGGPTGRLLRLSDEPHAGGHAPSADVLFESLAREYGPDSVGGLLTGMGEDGAAGLLELRRTGALTLAQDEESCVVYGMPRAAVLRGAVDRVLPLERMADALVAQARRVAGRVSARAAAGDAAQSKG
jgi:two-component system chemotaxis response regulator CheB